MPRTHGRRRALLVASLAVLLLASTFVVFYGRIVSYTVTSAALADAEEAPGDEREFERCLKEIAERYGYWFRKGYLDRGLLLSRMSADGFDDVTWGPFLVFCAYLEVHEDVDEFVEALREFARWLDSIAARPKTRELLVNVLAADYSVFEDQNDRDAGLPKLLLCKFLFMRGPELAYRMSDPLEWEEELGRWRSRFVALVEPEHWMALVRDLEHPREKVRAGTLLLLLHHPDRELFKEKAVAALDDPSRWVRLAAAGTLALEGDRRGAAELVFGLCHPRWEVRWWCGAGLAVLGTAVDLFPVAVAAELDPDSWVRQDLSELFRDAPGRKGLERLVGTVEAVARLEPVRAAWPRSFLSGLREESELPSR